MAYPLSYLLATRPSPQLNTLELRFQFRYAAPPPARLLELDPRRWFSPVGAVPVNAAARRKVEPADVSAALASLGEQVRYNELRQRIMERVECSRRTAQLAISAACQHGGIVQSNGHYRLPL